MPSPKQKITFKSAVLVESWVAQGAGVPGCVVGVAMDEVVVHRLGLDVHNLRGKVDHHSRVQVGAFDWAAAPSVGADVVPTPGMGVTLPGGVEASDQDLGGQLEGGWLGFGDP